MTVLSVGCASADRQAKGVGVFPTPPYLAALDVWSREGQLYDNLDLVLSARVVYWTSEFNEKYDEAISKACDAASPAAKRSAGLPGASGEGFYEFLIFSRTAEPRYQDLDNEKPTFVVRLRDSEGRAIEPATIKRLDSRNLNLTRAFPFMTGFERVYRLRFPRRDGAAETPVTLVVSCAAGRLEFDFPSRQN